MLLRTNQIKVTDIPRADGSYVVGIVISPEERMDFREEFATMDGEYQVEIKPYFGGTTKGQRAFFHRMLRMLAQKLKMSFDDTMLWFMTTYGFPEMDGENCRYLVVDSDAIKESTFKEGHYYFREISDFGGTKRFLIIRGLKLIDSREANLLLDFLKQECDQQEIKVLSDAEYEKRKREWETQKNAV